MITRKTLGTKNNFSLFTFHFSLIVLLSALSYADLSRSNGIVIDSTTGLQWQDDYSNNGGNVKRATWTAAIDYCEALNLGGTGWRLPNKKELLTVVDYTRYSPAINPVFSQTVSSNYWSSTTYKKDTSNAWVVSFSNCNTGIGNKSGTSYVRCVR